jgi:putative flippase GtrA
MQRLIAEGWRILRFGLVGGAATATNSVISVATHKLGVVPWLAVILGFIPAFAVSYLGHRHFTFKQGSPTAMVRFFVVALSGLAVGEGVLQGLLAYSPLSSSWCVLLSTLSAPAVTYVAARLWAFREEPA